MDAARVAGKLTTVLGITSPGQVPAHTVVMAHASGPCPCFTQETGGKPGSLDEAMGVVAVFLAARAGDGTKLAVTQATLVRLSYDVERKNGFGRTLAYVYRIEDAMFVNTELVKQGYVQTLTVPPNVAHAEMLRGLQEEARNANRGLWAASRRRQRRPGLRRQAPPPRGRRRRPPRPPGHRPRRPQHQGTATCPTPVCASRRHRQTSTVETSDTGDSKSSAETLTALMGTTTASVANRDLPRGEAQPLTRARSLAFRSRWMCLPTSLLR